MRGQDIADEYDYVVVGAGSAGCVMANRLSENPDVQVLLLEAGGSNRNLFVNMPAALSIPMNQARTNWGYLAEADPGLDNRRLDCPRGRGLGGSSAINGMVYVRGHPQDFEHWNQLINSESHNWSYAAVLPYFRRAEGCLDDQADERYRGRSGPLTTTNGKLANPLYERFLRACVEAGYWRSEDLNGYRQEGFGAFPMTVDGGIRCSAARAYLRPAAGRPNLKVVTGALVDRVAIDGHAARKLTWFLGSERTSTRVGQEIVLCGGAIESPCILQRSGVGPAELLRRFNIAVREDLPVGKNLMDHLEVYIQQSKPLTACSRRVFRSCLKLGSYPSGVQSD